MQAHIITRQIGIAMLAFGATFVQTSMFAASHFGGATVAPATQTVVARAAQGASVASGVLSPRA